MRVSSCVCSESIYDSVVSIFKIFWLCFSLFTRVCTVYEEVFIDAKMQETIAPEVNSFQQNNGKSAPSSTTYEEEKILSNSFAEVPTSDERAKTYQVIH